MLLCYLNQWRVERLLNGGCGDYVAANAPQLPMNDDRSPTSNDRKTSNYRQVKEFPTASVKVGVLTPHTPTSARP